MNALKSILHNAGADRQTLVPCTIGKCGGFDRYSDGSVYVDLAVDYPRSSLDRRLDDEGHLRPVAGRKVVILRKMRSLIALALAIGLAGASCGSSQELAAEPAPDSTTTSLFSVPEVTYYPGTGDIPSLADGCEFDDREAPGEPMSPAVATVIEWGGYESYGGKWHEPSEGPIVEGQAPTPLVVAIIGDVDGFDEWLDAEPGRRQASGIGVVVEADTPYCFVESGYRLLDTVPGMVMGGVTVKDGRQIIEVIVEAMDDIDLSDYPPFMLFTDEIKVGFGGAEEL